MEHGEYAKYVHDKCRCDECRAANTEYMQNYRAEHKAAQESDKQ